MNGPTTMSTRTPSVVPAHAIDPDDIGHNTTDTPSFDALIAARLSRRNLFRLGVGSAASAMMLSACGGGDDDPVVEPTPTPTPLSFNFNAVAKSLADTVVVPAGYTASVLYRLGDPITNDVPAYKNDGTDAAATYDRRAGDHHDGMTYFGAGSNDKWDASAAARGLLVMNHEAITPLYLHPTGQTAVGGVRTVAEEVLREFYLHGVSVIDVKKSGSTWALDKGSKFNRRVHTLTPMTLSGPAAFSDFMVTKYSPTGNTTRGTVNNCANGTTPWGTYLACEENWAGYFRRVTATDNAKRSAKELASFSRYGVTGTGRELWATVTPDTADDLYGRWNTEVLGASAVADYRNVSNTYGWVVEIDPFTPGSTPRKRTALGRFGHEGACLGPVTVGKPLVWYMGDDSQNEYLYKFVSTKMWDAADATGGLAAGDKYMDDGKLYVAQFKADGTGVWLELKLGLNNITPSYAKYAFSSQADVLINARHAADAAGATKMDRPEWTAVNPKNGDVYLTLTNNSARTLDTTDAANPRYYNDPKGAAKTAQRGNPNGHVVRFADDNRDPTATSFKWDVYLFGSRSTMAKDINVSGLTADNDFSSPDGMWFSQAASGLVWLQTDDGKITDVTNCMMLAGLPGQVGDGAKRTLTNISTDGATTKTQDTIVGAAPTSNTLRRFLVGPVACEITGIAESGDGRAIFVNIQHPGEEGTSATDPAKFGSHWPDGGTARPRSATIVITKNDGGRIGA